MSSVFSSDISPPEFSLGKDDKAFNFFMFIIIIIIFIIIVVPWNKLGNKNEHMSGGTITQLMAQDSQDVYLKNNVDKLATGNYNLFWNQGTREANVYQNRGQPLYSIILPDSSMNPTNNVLEVSNNYIDNKVNKKENKLTFSNPVLTLDNILPKPQINSLISNEIKDYETVNGEEPEKSDYLTLPKLKNSTKQLTKYIPTISKNILPSSLPIDIVSNSNPYELSFVGKQIDQTNKTIDNLPALTNWTSEDNLFQLYTDKAINERDCARNPASCGNGAGGSRLNDAFVQSTKSIPFVNLNGNYFYPDSYIGSYFIEPNFDISKPYPWIPNNNRV